MICFLPLLAALLVLPDAASAAVLGGLLSGTALGGGLAGLAGSIGVRLLASVALSALARAFQKKPEQPGIRTQFPTSGGTNPQSFIVGWYASEGNRLCPDYSYGSAGGTPNSYLVKIRDYGDMPGMTPGRAIVNGQFVTLDETPHADLGYPVLEFRVDGTDYAWVRTLDGTQTVADPWLLATFGSDPDFPWQSDMIGTGLTIDIWTFRFNRELFPGDPTIRREWFGIPLYDPRKDTTVGGSGSHLWADPSTWETTTNPQVIRYNIIRGIELPDGSIWGGGADVEAADLPLDVWFAAMNACDVVADGESVAQYQAGYEISVNQKPVDVLDELDKASAAQSFESGGVFKTRVGPVDLPVYFFTDDDIIVTEEGEFDPFPSIDETWNGIQATYPDPESLWNPKEAPGRYNSTWETADGERRVVTMDYAAAPYPNQVQRLMVGDIGDHRRFGRHSHVLPPDAANLEVLDAVSWTSARNGYTSKVFEVSRTADDQVSCNQAVALRERDDGDYDWASGDMLPASISANERTAPSAQTVPGWSVTASAVVDASSTARRAAVDLEWTPDDLDDVRAIRYQIRVKTEGTVISAGSTHDVDAGFLKVSEGILPASILQARGRLVADRPTSWTAWTDVTTGDYKLGYSDLVSQIATDIANAAKVPIVSSLPADDTTNGPVVLYEGDWNIYRWDNDASQWRASLSTALLLGQLTAGQIGAGIIGATHMASDTLSVIFASIGTLTSGDAGEDRVVIEDDRIQVIDGDGASGSGDVVRVKLGRLT